MEQKQPVIIILNDSLVEMENNINNYVKERYSIVTFGHFDRESPSGHNKPQFYCVLSRTTLFPISPFMPEEKQ